MASKEDKPSGDPDDLSFLRTEDYICLNCSVVTQAGVSRRMALAAEAFGNKMCFLEDISAENVTPDLPSCIFVLEQALSVRALQEVVNSTNNSSINSIQQSGHRTLLYGHAILLRHLQSNMYLTCLSTSTSNDKLAFDVGLQHDSQGESCWWTIHPASKQRSEGEKVRIGDDIILVSVASERYLHIYTVDSVIHRVNASFQQTLWTLLPISSGNARSKNAGFVFGGEVLRLFHGNMDQCFTLPQPGVSEHPYSIFYEAGTVCGHARSLWRLEFLRTRWYGGFMNWNTFVRLRHITSGRYLGVIQGEIAVIHRDKASADAITFILLPSKDDKRSSEVESEETMGAALMKYGDTLVYLQHVKSSCWVSYQTYETKKRGVGKIEEKKAALNSEGHMDDCFTIVRAQEEEARSALVIRKCMSLFTKFIRAMDTNAQSSSAAADRGAQLMNKAYWKKISLEKVLKCLDDLIEFFAQPPDDCGHEERQNKLKALRNRQDLFHEEGMITLVLETIDKYSETKDQANRTNIPLFDGYKQQVIDDIYDQLYALLATMIKGNRNNCAQFAQGNRLDCLISRLTSQQTSRGVLEVLHCILIDSPEALNMIKERHIQGIISLLDRNGRDPKVLSVLSSLCANKGIAVRTNQNLICDNLLPRRDLLIQSRLIRQTSSLRPNIMVGVTEGESVYKKWYFEVEIDYVELDPHSSSSSLPTQLPHCRIGWATTEYYATPDGADGFECVGVGDDCHSYGFDGRALWFAGRSRPINDDEFDGFRRGDVVGCLLDLSIPEIWFSLNGVPMKGFFREFSLTGMFYPVISVSPKISCRFLFGDEHGRFKSGPPEGCAPIYQAMLAKQKIKLFPCFTYGDMSKNVFTGPPQPLEQIGFTPQPVDTSQIQMPAFIESVRDKLAENLHEIWAMTKIEQGWKFGEFRNDNKKLHNCLSQFELLPREEKQFDITLATDTLKTMYALGYQLMLENRQDQKRIKLVKLPNTYLQINGYKPQPLDLNNITLNAKLELLVERLAENTHNVWAKERIKSGWTYGVCENHIQKRHPYLLPYDKVDPMIKKNNRETAADTIKTLLAYGYLIEPPSQEFEDNMAKKASEAKEKLKPKFIARTYRAEKTYAISSGKWYYECELLSSGSVKIGWSSLASKPNTDIAHCPHSYSFECNAARKWHQGSDAFGKQCQVADVIGVMIDLQDKTVCFSLNGEFLMDALGSECAFERVVNEGEDLAYVPAFTLGQGQKIRLNFGQDVNSLRYFTNCGLQEGYEPFAVNMTKPITFWYSNEIPIFETIDEQHDSLEINKNFAKESMPCIKLISKSFGTGKTKMEYLRLSLPVTFHDEFVPKAVIREKRMNALAVYKAQLDEEVENQQQMFNFDPPDFKHDNKSDTLDSNQLITSNQSNASGTSSGGSKPISSFFNKLTQGGKQAAGATTTTTSRSKSPFKFMQNRLSREPSPMNQSTGGASTTGKTSTGRSQQTKSSAAASAAAAAAAKVSRTSEYGMKTLPAAAATTNLQGSQQLMVNTSISQGKSGGGRKSIQPQQQPSPPQFDEFQGDQQPQDYTLMESDDVELQAIIDYVDEYYYGVRIFPGQDASKVYIGWTTSRFHLLADKIDRPTFDADALISKCTLINTSADGSILSSLTRKECFVICVSELTGDALGPDSGGGPTSKRITTSLLVGCQCDLATGQLTFLVNGKEASSGHHRFQVEPGTKLYPAVFVEPTTKEILQFELGRVKNCLPLSAALFPSLGKHVTPKCPPRLKLQFLSPIGWSRVPNVNLKVHTLKMNNVLGWSLLCEEPVDTQAIFIPEEDRWISILELNENDRILEFYHSMLQLYEAVCAQSNNYVAHQVCKLIDERQLMYCIQNQYMSGPLRKGFYDLLIKLHLESFVNTRQLSKYEFILPLSRRLVNNQLPSHFQRGSQFPSKSQFISVRPQIPQESEIKVEEHKPYLIAPSFNLHDLKTFVLSSFCESVNLCATHARDPIGGTNAYLFVPLIRMTNQLMIMDVFTDDDIATLLSYLDPRRFDTSAGGGGAASLEEGLVKLNLDDDIKYEICKLLHSLCDYILRYRVEAIVSFSSEFVKLIQSDQKRRYNELKESTLPSAIMARKTREFRCPARDQMQALVNFKSSDSKTLDISEDIKSQLITFHQSLNRLVQIKERDQEEDENAGDKDSKGIITKTISFIFSTEYYNSQLDNGPNDGLAAARADAHASNELVLYYDKNRGDKSWNALSLLITECVIEWAKKSFIYNENLIREMFHLIYRQYNSLGEVAECLRKTYVIAETSIKDVKCLLQSLSTVRNLLYVQMSPFEEEIMRCCLNEIMDNKVFFQHPDLMRALCVHETVMQVMINWLNRRQHQQDTDSSTAAAAAAAAVGNMGAGGGSIVAQTALPIAGEAEAAKEENTELVVVCCKFLSYFCRTSRHNQRAMFENFSYLLDNSAMLLARPSLRGSCPLDVACSSLMDNNDLSLALRESDLEKIAAYLSRCGLQTNSELMAKGYPDIGWDPVEGERFLDFLKFCVWVNGDSVEENANLIVRLLIRRPECLGPALRGEGGGLLKATIDGIRMSLQIAATQNVQNPIVTSSLLDVENELGIDFMNENKFDFSRIPSDEDEDYIDYGEAILAFYASLVELLGRCAPSEETIKMGKSDSIRGRSILRSLVSMEDLEGVLSLRFILPIPQQQALSEHLPGIQPTHKMSIVLFLERVYGIPDEDTYFRLLETGFLPDIRCATVLDSSIYAESDMALALNRYLCCSVLPLITSYAHYFASENAKTTLMETVLNIVYRLCRCKSLTKGQLDIVCDFLVAFTNQMKPVMMKNLLRKLIQDLPTLEEYTIVPLRMLTLWYERCGRYYGSSPIGGMQASEEEKRLTMTLFTRIFDSLAKRTYDPELFSKALPCLSAIGSALSPDYSYFESKSDAPTDEFGPLRRQYTLGGASNSGSAGFEPEPMQVASVTLTNDMEEIIKTYGEHVHDFYCHDRFEEGWSFGETYNDSTKVHPLLKPYVSLPRKDQIRYEDLTRETLKVIKALGWSIEKGEGNLNLIKNASRIIQKKHRDGGKPSAYQPKPFDLSNITLTREQDELATALAVNCHHIWARRKRNDLENIGAGLHHKLVPYDLLTDREKAADLQFSFELVKFLILNGYRLQNYEANLNENRNTFKMHHEDSEKLNYGKNEVRFAYNLLEKLLEYVEKAAINMQSIRESAKFSRKSSFKTSGQDVKFFTKVVLPLIEKYFKSHRSYFILKSNSTKSGSGCATFKEKEMTCSLFCKLALLIRKKLACFGSDSKITVRCLQVLIRAVDVSSVIKNSQEIVRASLLPFFSYAADDLSELISDLQQSKLANVKGTSQKTHANIDYIHMVLLPVLSSMFDHLAANNYGSDVLTGEIQVASYKALNALWILGTQNLIEREWIKSELQRHRPLIGECLGAFAAAFPIAFLEPQFNLNNRCSIMYGLSASNLSEHSLEGQDIMNKLAKNLPSLQDIINEIKGLCESGGKYEDAPHVIEILLPTICSYLTHWWPHGPSATASLSPPVVTGPPIIQVHGPGKKPGDPHHQQHQPIAALTDASHAAMAMNERQLTAVTSDLMNQTLGYILRLVSNNIEVKNAPWMNTIASFSQSIISTSTSTDLLEKNFLPVSAKIVEKARELIQREMSMKTFTRNVDSTDRESIESDLQKDFEVLIRNIYAFYPLLIKYVDLHRAYWLKNPDVHSEQLYYNIAEVFTLWLSSKMFKREETNFVSANDIDNMMLIMPKTASNLGGGGGGANAGGGHEGAGGGGHSSKNDEAESSSRSKGDKKKKRQKGETKKFTSLIVACLKRLFQIGINFFEGKEQELIQMAKQKFIDIKSGNELAMGGGASATSKQKAIQSAAMQQNNSGEETNLELSRDQEEIVEDFIRRYLKSSESFGEDGSVGTSSSSTAVATTSENNVSAVGGGAIDKETYQKTKWQRMLYRKIASKRHLVSTMQNLSEETIIQRIIEIAKVLYGLHMVEHPLVKSKGTWRKLISGQRKKAVMACFRMAPLHSIPHHRAINLFLKSYKQNWLENDAENDTDIACLIPDLCPEVDVTEEQPAVKAEAEGAAEGAKAVEAAKGGSAGAAGAAPGAPAAAPAGGGGGGGGEETSGESAESASLDTFETILTPDPLRQLISTFNRAATTDSSSLTLTDDTLYQCYATIMSRSCEIEEEDDDEDEMPADDAQEEEEDQAKTFKEEEMQKQKLLYEQGRLAERGAAEMCLLYISASKGEKSEMLEKTLELGISLLHGGNTSVQARMLKHLKDKKDVGFFTSLAGLMANCSVLDLDTFERCIKAEQFGGVSSSNDNDSGMAGKKNLHDADFTCSLFRFLQLLCEGHNLEFQNYLRVQPGNNTVVNTIICTVDYLLRLQESIMDFYWHYSGKSTVDAAGKENFCRAINVAKQVFNTLTEYIQGPCVGNQLTLAHSRLWDAIGGFLYIFANLQDKLSKDPHQIELLRELMKLQKDMIIMLLSMLEGNVLNGPIGKQMVDTLIENQQNVEMLLKFFDIFLKMKDLTTSDAFQEFDTNGDGWISPKEFKKAMEAQKMYSGEEIDYILMCVDTNQDGKIDFKEFTERFHNPAKDIGFNMAVLLTNLSEHMSHDARLDRLMKKASSFLTYFEPYLGRIEITGSSGKIERVYFEIKESNIEQWNKPQIKESKRQFLYDIVNEGDDKEKLEHFVNFCEDTIFEMQHAASMSVSQKEDSFGQSAQEQEKKSYAKLAFEYTKFLIIFLFQLFSPARLRQTYRAARKMSRTDFIMLFINLIAHTFKFSLGLVYSLFALIFRCFYIMIVGSEPGARTADETTPLLSSGASSGSIGTGSTASGLATSTTAGGGAAAAATTTTNRSSFGVLPSFEEHSHTAQMRPFGLSGVAERPEEQADANALGQELVVPESGGDLIGPEQEESSSGLKSSSSQKTASSIKTGYLLEEQEEDLNLVNAARVEPASSPVANYKSIMFMFARNFYKLKYLALVLAFLINFFMMFYKARKLTRDTLEEPADDADEADIIEMIMMDPDEYYIEHMLKALAFVHSLVAFSMMVAYYVLKVPLVIFKREKEIARKLEFQGLWIAEQPSDDDLRSHWDKLVLSTRTFPDMYWDKFVKKKVKTKYQEQFDLQQLSKLLGLNAQQDEYKFGQASKAAEAAAKAKESQESAGLFSKLRSIDWRYQIWKWGVIFTDNLFLYVFWYFAFSVFGNFNYFFFACHLLDVAISIKTLTTILKSITHNGKQLLLTIMLMSVIVYMYTVIAFNFFRKFYSKEEEGELEENCQDLFTCFKFHLYIGIRSGGGIGDELESPVGDGMEFYRIIFDITFFFFIIVILLAIIQGLIIDAFGELRDQLEQVKESLEASCFICGIGKEYFDKIPHGFEIHTMREHNFANYMYFLMHLINKPDTEYTGQETYVWQLYEQRCWDFFPAGDCFRKQHEGDEESS